MLALIEYRGLRALEYAAQTGAQLMRQRREGDRVQPIDMDIAQALWRCGAEQQILCVALDPRALFVTEPRPGWASSAKRSLRRLARSSRLARSPRRFSDLSQPSLSFARVLQASPVRGLLVSCARFFVLLTRATGRFFVLLARATGRVVVLLARATARFGRLRALMSHAQT